MRKQLNNDIKGCCNKDLAATLKALFEAHNALVVEYNALVAQLEADKGDITTTDFDALSSVQSVDID